MPLITRFREHEIKTLIELSNALDLRTQIFPPIPTLQEPPNDSDSKYDIKRCDRR